MLHGCDATEAVMRFLWLVMIAITPLHIHQSPKTGKVTLNRPHKQTILITLKSEVWNDSMSEVWSLKSEFQWCMSEVWSVKLGLKRKSEVWSLIILKTNH